LPYIRKSVKEEMKGIIMVDYYGVLLWWIIMVDYYGGLLWWIIMVDY